MPYKFIDDIALADVALEIQEKTLEALFATAADALLQIQIDDVESVNRDMEKTLTVTHAQVDMLLYRFLQELIYIKDAKHLLLRSDAIAIEHPKPYVLTAQMSGERLDPLRHEQKVDVKALTLHRFEVVQTPKGWKAFMVFDI